MDLQLRGKRALVTGSTGGIGLAIAKVLAREGAVVAVNGRTEKRVDDALASIRRDVPDASLTAVVADLSMAAGTDAAIRAIQNVDILVNNVGIYDAKPFFEIADAEWFRFFETNVMSGVRLSRHYLSGMRGKNWGRIIFVSSESAVQIPAEMIHYGMTKTAQVAIARGLAETVAGTNITVNSVLPGPTRSEGVETFIQQMGAKPGADTAAFENDFFKTIRPTSLLKRFETVDEVANMIVYLCSPLASGTTGAALRVEGGVVRAIL